jgi:protein SCO1
MLAGEQRMDRRNFLGLGLAPLGLAVPALAAQEAPKRVSRAYKWGMFPNVPLVTHDGRNVRFYDDLIQGDKIVVLNFFYTRCTDGLCPTGTYNLSKAQQVLGDRMGRDIFFYSITLDPENDTPSVIKGYAEAFNAKPGWTFLTGKPDDIEHLRRALGFVDTDPDRDKDKSTHVAVARYGDDALDRWASVSTQLKPQSIAVYIMSLKM